MPGISHVFSWCPSLPHLLHLCDPPGVKTTLMETVSLGLRTLAIWWSDSQSLITAISSKRKIAETQGVMFDIEHLCTFFSSISFHHVPRLNNAEEDAVASWLC